MAKENKPLTIKQQAKKEKRISRLLFASEFVAIPTPFIIMGGVNFNEWFINNPEGWRIGLGGGIGIALMSFVALMVALKKENKDLTGGYLAIIFGYYMLGFIAMLLAEILTQIYQIIFITGTGLISAMGLDIASKKEKAKADKHFKAIDNAQLELDTQQAKEEIVRVRIKK
jgi:hypothetical protein